MEGIKLINASEVVTSKKTSKVEIKKVSKSPMKIIIEDNRKNVVDSTSGNSDIVRPDIVNVVKHDVITKIDIVTEVNIGSRVIRAIKLKENIYYGPKNANKNKFVRLYKKFCLKWITDVSLNGMMVDGWFNNDKSQYIIKLLEDGDFKRFKFYGCDEIYDYFVNLGGATFDHNKENSLSPNFQNNKINNAESIKNDLGIVNQNNNVISTVGDTVGKLGNVNGENNTNRTKDNDEEYRFIGADLWSGCRTRQLLKKMPDNWGIIWK